MKKKENSRIFRVIMHLVYALVVMSVLWSFGQSIIIAPIIEEPTESVVLSCEKIGGGYCIEVEFKTSLDYEGLNYSSYSFPHALRQGDYLYLDNIVVYRGSSGKQKNISGATLFFDVVPDGGHIDFKGENYGKFSIRLKEDIPIFGTYEIKRKANGRYVHLVNGEEIERGDIIQQIEMYRIGEWLIENSNDLELDGTTLVNGRWEGDIFYVHPRHEIENSRMAKKALIAQLQGIILILATFFTQLIYFVFKDLHDD